MSGRTCPKCGPNAPLDLRSVECMKYEHNPKAGFMYMETFALCKNCGSVMEYEQREQVTTCPEFPCGKECWKK